MGEAVAGEGDDDDTVVDDDVYILMQGMVTLVEVYTAWAGPCVSMTPVLTKIKVDLQVKQGLQTFHEKLQFTSACSDSVQASLSSSAIPSLIFTFHRHLEYSAGTVSLYGYLLPQVKVYHFCHIFFLLPPWFLRLNTRCSAWSKCSSDQANYS